MLPLLGDHYSLILILGIHSLFFISDTPGQECVSELMSSAQVHLGVFRCQAAILTITENEQI